MSIIMDALEKAQRDRERKKGEVTEENLLYPVFSPHTRFSTSRGLLYIIAGNLLVVFIAGVVFTTWRSHRSGEKKNSVSERNVLTDLPLRVKTDEQMESRKRVTSKPVNVGPVYKEELVLDNGLRLKVDGVYLDNKIPHALIGPDIVKKGDSLEGGVKVVAVDFKKVEVIYKSNKYYLLVN